MVRNGFGTFYFNVAIVLRENYSGDSALYFVSRAIPVVVVKRCPTALFSVVFVHLKELLNFVRNTPTEVRVCEGMNPE